MRRRMIFLSLAFAMVVALLPANVFASDFRLRVEDISAGPNNGTGVVLTDQKRYDVNGVLVPFPSSGDDPFASSTVGDQNGTEGLLQVSLQPLSNAVQYNLTLGISKPQPLYDNDPEATEVPGMRLTSFNVTASQGATVRITLEDTGFSSPGGAVNLKSILGGAFYSNSGITVQATSWANTSGYTPELGADTKTFMAGAVPPRLQPGSLDVIGANVGQHTDTLVATSSGIGPYEEFGDEFETMLDSGPSYSLFTQLIITFAAAGSVDFFHDTLLTANEQLTPEPASLLLIGTGLVGLAMRRRSLMR